MSMTPLPTLDRTSATFRTDVDTFFASDLPQFVTEANALETNVVAKELAADGSADAAAASEIAAATSATEAAASAVAAASDAPAWVSGTTYTLGQTVWSPIDYLTYRRIVAGGGTTDPSLDATNWLCLTKTRPSWSTITANPSPAVVGAAYMCNTTASAFTVTLPAAPAANDIVRIADYAGTFATNNLTLGRNALKIMGLAEDMVISTDNVSLTLQYIDATQGWRIV